MIVTCRGHYRYSAHVGVDVAVLSPCAGAATFPYLDVGKWGTFHTAQLEPCYQEEVEQLMAGLVSDWHDLHIYINIGRGRVRMH